MGIPVWRECPADSKPSHSAFSSLRSPIRRPNITRFRENRRVDSVARFVQAAIRAAGPRPRRRDAQSEQVLLARLVNEIFEVNPTDSRTPPEFRDSDATNDDDGEDLEESEILDREHFLPYRRERSSEPFSSAANQDAPSASSLLSRRIEGAGLAEDFQRFSSIPPISDGYHPPSSSTNRATANVPRVLPGFLFDSGRGNDDRPPSASRQASLRAHLQSLREQQRRTTANDGDIDNAFPRVSLDRRARRPPNFSTVNNNRPDALIPHTIASVVSANMHADRVLRGEREARVRELVNGGGSRDRTSLNRGGSTPSHIDRLASARLEVDRYDRYSNRDRSVRFG